MRRTFCGGNVVGEWRNAFFTLNLTRTSVSVADNSHEEEQYSDVDDINPW